VKKSRGEPRRALESQLPRKGPAMVGDKFSKDIGVGKTSRGHSRVLGHKERRRARGGPKIGSRGAGLNLHQRGKGPFIPQVRAEPPGTDQKDTSQGRKSALVEDNYANTTQWSSPYCGSKQ